MILNVASIQIFYLFIRFNNSTEEKTNFLKNCKVKFNFEMFYGIEH